jgi:two-component system, cell cycle response regulator
MKILVADDDPTTRDVLETLLTDRGYEVVTASDGNEAHATLIRDDAPPLAIVDWMMPGREGVEVCRELRKAGKTSYTYVVMLSGRREKEDFIAGLAAGADEYVRKPFDIDELHARIQAAERILRLHEELRTKANEDHLTGLMNRGAILSLLQRICSHVEREAKGVAVIFVDLDNFKAVNDKYGHLVGDAVLREIAQRLGWSLRAYDAVGRYGGEEFLIVLPACAGNDARHIAERLRSLVAEEPVNTSAGPIAMTVSLGVADSERRHPAVDDLIDRADRALYHAKQAGRNRVEGPDSAAD